MTTTIGIMISQPMNQRTLAQSRLFFSVEREEGRRGEGGGGGINIDNSRAAADILRDHYVCIDDSDGISRFCLDDVKVELLLAMLDGDCASLVVCGVMIVSVGFHGSLSLSLSLSLSHRSDRCVNGHALPMI